MSNHPDLVRDICAQEGLGTGALQPLDGGQTNSLFRLGCRYVLRIGRDAEAGERLRCEAGLLRTLAHKLPVPHVYAAGECRGVPYQVQEFIQGEPLHRMDALRSYFDEPAGEELAIYPLAKASNMLLDHGARMFFR